MKHEAPRTADAPPVAPHERRVAARVFEVAPDVYRIPLPTDFPVGDVNVYLVDGPAPLLVDTGVRGKQSLATLAEALEAIHRGVADIATVVLTHVHVDHAGSARAVHELSGAPVYVHPRGVARLENAEEAQRRALAWFEGFLVRSGLSHKAVDRYRAIAPVFLRYASSCSALVPLTDGQQLEVAGGRPLRSHFRPGHTTTDVVYVLEDEGLAFTGDHLLPHITSNPTIEPPAVGDAEKPRPLVLYQESLRATRELGAQGACRRACPGHAPSFDDVVGRCDEALRLQRERVERVWEILRDDGPATRKELGRAVFGDVKIWDVFLTLSEIQAALEVLEVEGRVERVAGDDASPETADRYRAR